MSLDKQQIDVVDSSLALERQLNHTEIVPGKDESHPKASVFYNIALRLRKDSEASPAQSGKSVPRLINLVK